MRLLVTGGRDYKNRALVFRVLDQLAPIEIIHGDCNLPESQRRGPPVGADFYANEWAIAQVDKKRVGFVHSVYYADWNGLGKPAGPIRNADMIDSERPDLCLAFPGGAGTADCARKARRAGIPVLRVEP